MNECLFKLNDRVTRKNVNAFRYMQGIDGRVVSIKPGNRCYIKWDIQASTGQQHSTISERFLRKIT